MRRIMNLPDCIGPVLGRKHCGWCTIQPEDTYVIEKLKMDGYYSDMTWLGKKICRVESFATKHNLTLWKVGRSWHHSFHPKEF